MDRVTSITQSGNDVADKRVDFDYDAIGQYESISRYSDLDGNDLVVESSYSYDDANRLTNLTHGNVAEYDFEYDGANRITSIRDVDGVSNYSYDDTDQLTSSDRSILPDESYSYDKNGNRTNAGYVTGENNQLLSDGKYNYEYDSEGNLTRQVEIATGKVQEFTWDYLNRLVAVVDKDSSGNQTQRVEYIYDINNRRIAQVINGQTRNFVYDGNNVALEFVNGQLDKRYLFGTQIDEIIAQENSNGSVDWHLSDHLGTIRDLVGNSGNLEEHYSFDAFGNLIIQSVPKTRYLFTGREWDEPIERYYYRERFYLAPIGRFIEEDSIGFDGGDSNLYRYVGNNPVNATDPTGNINTKQPGSIPLSESPEFLKLSVWDKILLVEKVFTGWRDVLPKCPCLEKNVKMSSSFYDQTGPWTSKYHPGAEKEYRSNPVPFFKNGQFITRAAQQCTYKDGKLITDNTEAAGTPDFHYSSSLQFISGLNYHDAWDVKTSEALGWVEYNKIWVPDSGDGKCDDRACNNSNGIA